MSVFTITDVRTAIEASDVTTIKTAYTSADVKGKAQVRKTVSDVMGAAIDNLDLTTAKAARDLLADLKTVRTASATVDPRARYATWKAAVAAFAVTVADGTFVPSAFADVDLDGADDLATDDDEVKIIVDRFAKVAVSAGVRRSISAHVAEVFAGREVGTFLTYTEVANVATEVYGTDRPSAGAVAAFAASDQDKGDLAVTSQKRGSREVAGFTKVA